MTTSPLILGEVKLWLLEGEPIIKRMEKHWLAFQPQLIIEDLSGKNLWNEVTNE